MFACLVPGCLISNPIKTKQSKKKTPVIISLSQPKKPDKAITMKHLRVFFFALLLLASPLLQGNITVSSSHFIDPDPDLHALAKRILFCSWTLSLFFFLIWNSCVVYQFFLSCQSIELRSIWFGYLEILLIFRW